MPQIFLNCLWNVQFFGIGTQNTNVISFLNVEWHQSRYLSRSSSSDVLREVMEVLDRDDSKVMREESKISS